VSINENRAGTRQVCFRVPEWQHQAFIDLVGSVPGGEAGSMFREVFTRGLKSLQDHYGHGSADQTSTPSEEEKGA
jgi:hypothetical protein